ncbi:MAG TPA: LLM class flavin-dependent oxidoreductase [candidate division Zixibacteria bacterium]|nr:LLM class flavin-dependent oxidoreductase [candidate division Zixibacteria bacterium]
MKVSLFTEIQCPDGSVSTDRLNELIEQAEIGDRLGFHGLWLAEIHCQPRFSLLSAPYVVLGALAQRTRRLRLGVAVNTLPVHHPVQLAEQAAMLDLLSGGRMEFAAGGGHPHSRVYECFGADHSVTHEILAEGLDVIRRAWTEPTLSFEGRFFRIPEVVVHPKPIQQPPPPFYLATSSMAGVELGARLAANLMLPVHTRAPEQVTEFARAYWDGLKRHGHSVARRELALLVPVHIAETANEAERRCEAGVMSYFETIAAVRRDYVEWLARRGVPPPARLATAAGQQMTFEVVRARHAVIGDARSVAAGLKKLAAATGARHFLAWFNIGSVPHRWVKDAMERFAGEVMSELDG